MAIDTAEAPPASSRKTSELIISSDSHVMEPIDLWSKALASEFGDAAPKFPPRKTSEEAKTDQGRPGGSDPHARLTEMLTDGVNAEVLYPTLGLRLFGLDDAKLQEACFRVFNDWLIEYCQIANARLLGVACIPIYDTDVAIKELERCKKNGLAGALIWQAPHPDLPLYSDHYERFWTACEELDMPISLHILTGHNYSKMGLDRSGVESYRGSVNLKTVDAMNALFDLTFYGILHRHPNLKIVIVENEIGWIPFTLQQWDYYYRRFRESNPPPIDHEPSWYFNRQVYATFFNDPAGAKNFNWGWGIDQCMWSNDYPHANSTWPNSLKVIARDLGHLPEKDRAKLVRDNCVKLYNMQVADLV
jgi:predicted TIM-barrel fold metal-dependent hydrolase